MSEAGKILYHDSEEKLIAKVPGRISMKKVREAVKAHLELELKDLEPGLIIPFENASYRDQVEVRDPVESNQTRMKSVPIRVDNPANSGLVPVMAGCESFRRSSERTSLSWGTGEQVANESAGGRQRIA